MRLLWPDLPMLRKPLNPERLVEALGALCGELTGGERV